MIELSEAQVKGFIEVLVRVIPRGAYRFDEVTLLAWHPFLKCFSVDELQWFIGHAVDNLDEFPSLKKIRGTIRDRRNGLLAVDPVVALMGAVKNRDTQSEPIRQLALKFGGWEVIGLWAQDQWEFKRKSIVEAWEQIKKTNYTERDNSVSSAVLEKKVGGFTPRSDDELKGILLNIKKLRGANSENGLSQ